MGKRVLLSGYYGFANAGDEAVCAAILQSMASHGGNPDITVLSADPAATTRMHGRSAVARKRLLAALPDCDALIQGGGSLLQDTTSARSVFYYLWVIMAARMIRRPVFIYAQGVGPLRRKPVRAAVRAVLSRVQSISVRDRDSRTLLTELNVNRPPMYLTADPVWALEAAPDDRANIIWERQGLPSRGRTVGMALRAWPSAPRLAEEAAAAADALQSSGFDVVLVPMQRPHDEEFAASIQSQMPRPAPMLQGLWPPADLMALLGKTDLLIGMRLHALILAAARGVPVTGISYDPKVTSLMAELRLPPPLIAGAANAAAIVQCAETSWHGKEAGARRMAREVQRLRDNALGTARLAKAFLETDYSAQPAPPPPED